MTTTQDTRLPVDTKLLNFLFSRINISTQYFYKNVPCWEWSGSISKRDGYSCMHYSSRMYGGHRLMYLLFVGSIAKGLHTDHLCRVRHCVNPSHIEPVTPRINTLRGIGPAAKNAVKTHCKRGHPLAGINLKFRDQKRICLTCESLHAKRHNDLFGKRSADDPKKMKHAQQTKEWWERFYAFPYDHPRRVEARVRRNASRAARK